MAKFCGGFKFDSSLKLIDGILCLADTQAVDPTKAVTGCGQMWDGESFKVVKVDGYRPCITLKNNIHKVKMIAGNCGVGLDADFFDSNGDDEMVVTDGYVLTVETTPENANVSVIGEDGNAVTARTDGTFVLPDLDGNYSVTVTLTGHTGKTRTIKNDKSQTISVDLDAITVIYDNNVAVNKGYGGTFYVGSAGLGMDLQVGENYVIDWDGQSYQLVAKEVTGEYAGVYLGEVTGETINVATDATFGAVVSNPSFTNYPFAIYKYGAQTPTIYAANSGTYNLKVEF